MPSKKQKEADAAYLRAWGQIDLEEQIAQDALQSPISGGAQVGPIEIAERVPHACPDCGEGVPTGRVTIWTHMLKRDTGPYRIQCGNCGKVVWCSEQVWKEVKHANAVSFGGSDVRPPKKHRERRERGSD